jgi:glycosyltransferase involved in cell wall biosynthesis
MLRDYRGQSDRLALLSKYRLILSNSKHMQQEFTRHGLKTKCLSLGIRDLRLDSQDLNGRSHTPEKPPGDPSQNELKSPGKPWRLLFLGRMDRLKGGAILIESLRHLADAGSPELILTLAGDGPERTAWERKARTLLATTKRISAHFPGWLDKDMTRQILSTTDLLVIPSVWPEPFGLVGPEAGLAGVPAVAFNVGGIPDWLINGVNGLIVEATPPRPENLARAIMQCLSDPATYARLSRSAVEEAARFNIDAHATRLVEILDRARSERIN